MTTRTAVDAVGVTKSFGPVRAVEDISIRVAAGEVYGVLGPNGAGKTTFLRMLFGLIRPDEGEIRVFGRTWQRDGVRVLDGVAGFIESPRFYPYLTGRQNLAGLARLDGGARRGPYEFAAVMVPSIFSPSAESEVVAPFVDSVRAFHPGGFRAMARARFEDQSHVLPEVDVPTLLLYADHDSRAPVAVGEAMHALVRGSNLVVLRGPGHVSSVEAPNDVTRALRRLLRSIRSSEDAG